MTGNAITPNTSEVVRACETAVDIARALLLSGMPAVEPKILIAMRAAHPDKSITNEYELIDMVKIDAKLPHPSAEPDAIAQIHRFFAQYPILLGAFIQSVATSEGPIAGLRLTLVTRTSIVRRTLRVSVENGICTVSAPQA